MNARRADLVCFSHLRWDFVYQRPQHLMSRFARTRAVHFVEEPVHTAGGRASLAVTRREGGVAVVVPMLPDGLTAREAAEAQREMLTEYIRRCCGQAPTFWFQSPMFMPVAPLSEAGVVVYDCMDELSAFRGAPPSLLFNEKQLLARAHVVFTGGRALYEAKVSTHPRVHCVPSGIDVDHFARALPLRTDRRRALRGAASGPRRIGFAGVLDERLDLALLAAIAGARPDYELVMVGPVVKIDEADLPRAHNIRYVGMRPYADLPECMAQWDAAILPFALNEATRYISPTKTPEYLAAGLPVVSTAILDVVRDYGDRRLVAIAEDAAGFVAALDAALERPFADRLQARIDEALRGSSWDAVWSKMASLERVAERAVPRESIGARTADAAG